ncbi:hypothetical protein RVBP17_3380 [Pseudomonas phage sp. 30-3]|nr:hypothetical protein RVBP17_3380 [Pseudomonas phage sp. 30-3]
MNLIFELLRNTSKIIPYDGLNAVRFILVNTDYIKVASFCLSFSTWTCRTFLSINQFQMSESTLVIISNKIKKIKRVKKSYALVFDESYILLKIK